MLNFDQYKVLTFDCYGTLVDWESAIRAAVRPVLATHQVGISDEALLADYGAFEAEAESGLYQCYRDVLHQVLRKFGEKYGFDCSDTEASLLPDTFDTWQPFPDTVAALQSLKQRYRLVILSNTDDDLFAITAKHLQVPFDDVITAQQVGSYKPSHRNFEVAMERVAVPKEQILHVAQSLYHDIVPTNALGIANVWVNRYGAVTGKQSSAQPNLEVPDMQTLASLAQGARP